MAGVTSPRPLSESDDRSHFDCGRESLNHWFQRHGWANHAGGASRVNVICDADSGVVVGYVTLSAAQIERVFLPKSWQRNKPDPLPVTLLGQLAVHINHQKQGHARSLFAFACRTSLRAAESVGSIGIITHPLDEDLRKLYSRRGFEDLPFDPHRAMLLRMIDLRQNNLDT